MNCNKKEKYFSKQLADEYCAAYNEDILVNQSESLCSYWCHRHRSWHIGHLNSSYPAGARTDKHIIGLMGQIAQEQIQYADDQSSLD